MIMYCDQCEDEPATYWVITKDDPPFRICEPCHATALRLQIKEFEDKQRAEARANQLTQ